jgi:hypothetical protein
MSGSPSAADTRDRSVSIASSVGGDIDEDAVEAGLDRCGSTYTMGICMW